MKMLKVIVILLSVIMISSCRPDPIQTFKLPKQTVFVARLQPASVLDWNIPAAWRKQTAGRMVKESYRLDQQTDPAVAVVVSISVFPGEVGSLLSNINRWRNQLTLPAISEKDISKYAQSQQTNGGIPFTHINIENNEQGLSVVILKYNEQQYFFKLTGPANQLPSYQTVFKTFIRELYVKEN